MRVKMGPAYPIAFEVSEKVYQKLEAMAAERGTRPAVYAKMLFEAAFSARVGIQSDPDLDAAIARAVLLAADGAEIIEIAGLVNLSPKTVDKVLDAWRAEMADAA